MSSSTDPFSAGFFEHAHYNSQDNASFFIDWFADETEFPPLPITSHPFYVTITSSFATTDDTQSIDFSPFTDIDDGSTDLSSISSTDTGISITESLVFPGIYSSSSSIFEQEEIWSTVFESDRSISTQDEDESKSIRSCTSGFSIMSHWSCWFCCCCSPCNSCLGDYQTDGLSHEEIFHLYKARAEDAVRVRLKHKIRQIEWITRAEEQQTSGTTVRDLKRTMTNSIRRGSPYRISKIDHKEFSVLYNSRKQYRKKYDY